MNERETETTIDSKYIQQHLANERTYLAWIRTSITIIGVGFLITNLHFSTLREHQIFGDLMAEIIGLASIFVGMITLILSTLGYFQKGKGINNQRFKYSKALIVLLSLFIFLIFLIFGTYYLITWGLI